MHPPRQRPINLRSKAALEGGVHAAEGILDDPPEARRASRFSKLEKAMKRLPLPEMAFELNLSGSSKPFNGP